MKLKIKLNEIYERYIKKYYFKCKIKLKILYFKISQIFHNSKNIKSLIIIEIFIFIGIIFYVINPSFAIYQNNYEFSFLRSIVGSNKYDYTLLIFLENTSSNGTDKYSLSNNIPLFGYTYSGYNCNNDSILTYDEKTKSAKVDLLKKDICYIYFDISNSVDISTLIMLEDEVNSNTYSISSNIPYYGYKYSYYECDNDSKLTYDSIKHLVNIQSSKIDVCKIFFKKDKADIEISLYVESAFKSNTYNKMDKIPSDVLYNLNKNMSECLNNNERIETTMNYTNGYIEIDTKNVTNCKVYLNVANE